MVEEIICSKKLLTKICYGIYNEVAIYIIFESRQFLVSENMQKVGNREKIGSKQGEISIIKNSFTVRHSLF